MRIAVVNPNTTESMTRAIERCAREVAGPGTQIDAVTAPMGPASIESHYDEALSVPGVLTAISSTPADGYVLACFGDPGLYAAREVAGGAPVVGIAQAAMHAASLLGRGFSVVTTLARTVGMAWDLAARYHLPCRGVHACEIPVLALDTDPDAPATIVRACREALLVDSSDAIVLGCAGMADLAAVVSTKIGAPVVDGVAAAVLLVESLIRLGLRSPSGGEFAAPPPKPYTGVLAAFGMP